MKRSRLLTVCSLLIVGLALLHLAACNSTSKEMTGTPPDTTRSVTLISGLSLEYLEMGDPGGMAVVFLHGYTDSHDSFSRVAPLMPREVHAFYLTMRGHGNSARPGAYAMDLFASDVAGFMDQVGIEHAVVVGHSMGSFIAQRVALDFPEKVTGLVLIGSGASCSDNAVLAELKTYVDTLKDPIDRGFVREFQASTVAAPVPDAFLSHVVDESMKLKAHVWKEVLAELMAVDHRDQVSAIVVPTLVLWGEKDGVFGAADQLYLGTHIPEASLKLYADTGHGLQWERPERFVADLSDFLKTTHSD
ncbi:alpha/beta fold hydrolase [Desulfoluna spongiiphila]|uniref:Pimeloyl-ACP methyl ester carboxylesterase n=1 Tax=Desulfoluna spongiiphila TaxID=419481 RepID=A0A1G5ISE5_9BACT|nr:alpha/beta hydrolase [Desulfoluna spongiiphila]SCY78670.1 Pimeloyl-ACP methyl ester carboxylesterase [Desulfoluna spongiiphila]